MISAALIGDKEVMARMRGLDPQAHAALLRVIVRLSIMLQARIKSDKLSGQVLHRRTGTLSRSINRKIEDTPTSIVASVGTNVRYAAIHEFGFNGTEQVKAHLRTIHQAFGRPIAETTVQVSAHARHMVMPKRSFLRSALEDLRAHIHEEMAAALTSAVKAP